MHCLILPLRMYRLIVTLHEYLLRLLLNLFNLGAYKEQNAGQKC